MVRGLKKVVILNFCFIKSEIILSTFLAKGQISAWYPYKMYSHKETCTKNCRKILLKSSICFSSRVKGVSYLMNPSNSLLF